MKKRKLGLLLVSAVLLAGVLTTSCKKEKVEDDYTFTVEGVTFEMIPVAGGTFSMGATEEQGTEDPYTDESPVHQVTLSDYSIGQFEVTQGLWKAVMGENPSVFQNGDDYPVENVNWSDCQAFIKKLKEKTGKTFSLPTEAQWEYAARGGKKSKHYKYAGGNDINAVAWYSGNMPSKNSEDEGYGTQPVGTKTANELGIYDMNGNVYEWCSDLYDKNYYQNSPSADPAGPSAGSYRVMRGGCWSYSAGRCRVSSRYYFDPDQRGRNYGLRLVLVP